MRYQLLIYVCIFTQIILLSGCDGQKSIKSNIQSNQYEKGYPVRDAETDLLLGFQNPPKGYGNVPFYWWSGDHLNKERLKDQLDLLSTSATDGFAVSYIHTYPKVDSVFNKDGYGLYGRTEPGDPAVFSEEWWKLWKWFSKQCAERGLGVGLDDYTVGWTGNGYYPDEVVNTESFQNYPGKLAMDVIALSQGDTLEYALPSNFLTAVAWPGMISLDRQIRHDTLYWCATDEVRVYIISTEPGYALHPDYGQAMLDVYFNRFERNVGQKGKKGMNYFFQDELSYPIDMLSWSDDFQFEFYLRKDYDITPYLPALKEYIGPITPKIRLDYAEVLMDLAEKRYFRPIYQWHADRGLIYGCDNLGRGLNPLSYVDYFRAISWYTAPGNDAPAKGSSFLQTKISSSVAHLYNRPRTWLEAFHSMGWGSSGEWLTQQIDHHFMAGGNLVCMHGLYYSTHGGWWEWAPPCFHFRMPYWEHMKKWLEYTERMSYVLSQGTHVCDIALLYPTESMQAYPDATPATAFQVGENLSDAGLDYDFVDFRSVRDGKTADGTLELTNEKYKILVMAGMKALHHSTLEKALDFYRSGGIVLATGELPKASSLNGEQDESVDNALKEIFGLTAAQATSDKYGPKQTNQAGGVGWYLPQNEVVKTVQGLITPDFMPSANGGKVLHRRIKERDVYMVMNVDKGSECFFRSKGKVELWNANDGTTQPFPIVRQDAEGTWLRMGKEYTNSYLIVFSPGEPVLIQETKQRDMPSYQVQLNDEWDVELLPTMNNKWGDFRLPASDELIGAEARMFKYMPAGEVGMDWVQPGYDDSVWNESVYGYGAQVETSSDSIPDWRLVSYSWQYGIWDQPGSQGYHGLKSKVSDAFFVLDGGGRQVFKTYMHTPKSGKYRLEQEQTPADSVFVDGEMVTDMLYLHKGWHMLEVIYHNTPLITDYAASIGRYTDFRPRGAVVFLPEKAPEPVKPTIYQDRLAMKWTDSEHLYYDPYQGKHDVWNYRFRSAPGMKSMTFTVKGTEPQVWVNGEKLPDTAIKTLGREKRNGTNRYIVRCTQKQARAAVVAFSIKTHPGCQGTGAIMEPVKIHTSTGKMGIGDWSMTGALRYYSGGMRYSRDLRLPPKTEEQEVWLDLGDVVATCEVFVNGISAGIMMSSPYRIKIGPYVKEGNNHIEIIVYSTLANHYQTIPTPYRGDPKAGLIGPVKLSYY